MIGALLHRIVCVVAVLGAIAFATSCSSTRWVPGSYAMHMTWSGVCHRTFRRDIERLAGPNAIDCGFIGNEWSKERIKATRTCIADAMASNSGFKAGYFLVGDDGTGCDAVVRTEAGEIVSYSTMYSPLGSGIWVSRCEKFKLPPDPVRPADIYSAYDCKSADSLLESISK